MTKQEFLRELEKKLQGLPKDDLNDRLSFYEESINDRMEEGKSEEEAVAELGTVDEIVNEIAKDVPLHKLVKERVKPKRSLKAWEIVLLVLGFPLWFPLILTALILCIVFYLLTWILVIVTYALETGFWVAAVSSLVVFFMNAFSGSVNLVALGSSIATFGLAILFIFACIGATKVSILLSKKIVLGIKSAFIKKGNN